MKILQAPRKSINTCFLILEFCRTNRETKFFEIDALGKTVDDGAIVENRRVESLQTSGEVGSLGDESGEELVEPCDVSFEIIFTCGKRSNAKSRGELQRREKARDHNLCDEGIHGVNHRTDFVFKMTSDKRGVEEARRDGEDAAEIAFCFFWGRAVSIGFEEEVFGLVDVGSHYFFSQNKFNNFIFAIGFV